MKPLTFGSVLIAGIKPSSLSDDLRNHPRVILWDNEDERWHGKDLPQNVRAVFTTRWIGHSKIALIRKEARKRNITIFPCETPGKIAKMVTELLTVPEVHTEVEEMEPTNGVIRGKLTPLIQFIDQSKSQKDNALFLIEKAKELNIETTIHSVTNLVYRKTKTDKPPVTIVEPTGNAGLDISVQVLDNAIKELTDMRAFLIATVQENDRLKARLAKYKKMLEED